MLVTIAADLGVPLSQAAAASAYFLLYGLMQPVWGMMVSDWLGRVRTMRLTMVGVLVPGLLSALAPSLAMLVVARALPGGLFAAVIPASLVYIGDTVPSRHARRPWPISWRRARWRRPWRGAAPHPGGSA